ncbi:MAG TPA: hypothetical protein V6D11_31245 [Waterburya sp.]|jgi:hypothetical protein
MAESIQEVFWLLSADRQQSLYVSPAFETIWDRPLESLYIELNAHLNVMMDSIHPSDKEQVIAAFAQRLENSINRSIELYDRMARFVGCDNPNGMLRDRASFHPEFIWGGLGTCWTLRRYHTANTWRKFSINESKNSERWLNILLISLPDLLDECVMFTSIQRLD